MTPQPQLFTVPEVSEMILRNRLLVVSGDEHLLAQLPPGSWIGGTVPYFTLPEGGIMSQDGIFVTDFTDLASAFRLATYDENTLARITGESYENGFTFLILPFGQPVHFAFALQAPGFENLYQNPLTGLVAGFLWEDFGKVPARTYIGNPGSSETQAVALHVCLPESKLARMEIINIFSPDEQSETITFEEEGFVINDCLIGGKRHNLGKYIQEHRIDIRLPLITDYSGAMINVSLQGIDPVSGSITAGRPVEKNRVYYFAKPVGDYEKAFEKALPEVPENEVFSCNCILNYLHGGLQGKKTASTGPISFGEIGYILLNQTLTYLVVEES
jgi:hypothetical protein